MSLCFYFCVPWCLKIKCVNVCGCQMSLLMINAKILRFPLVLCILMKQRLVGMAQYITRMHI